MFHYQRYVGGGGIVLQLIAFTFLVKTDDNGFIMYLYTPPVSLSYPLVFTAGLLDIFCVC